MEILYRPKFCANCGEKVERAEWRIWTSGRYCEVCESQHKGRELLPRLVVGASAIALIVSGISLVSGSLANADQSKVVPMRQVAAVQPQKQPTLEPAAAANVRPAITAENKPGVQTQPAAPAQTPSVVTDEAIYMCGAETRKGTACTRRVKGKVRCWQHTGMPAMVAQEKLRVS